MKKIRVGVVGVGYLGKFHAEKYANIEDVELVGVVDVNHENACKIAENVKTRPYCNHKELIGKVDAVSIVVPTQFHFSVAKDFLENGADVLIEKPITTTVDEADELIKIANSKGLIIQVGHLERFNPAVLAVKDIVNKPIFIESHRLGIYKERGIDVSVVLDLMIHDIDIIRSFVKSDIKELRASGVAVISSNIDIANARIEFKSGCVANVTASRISMKNERKIRLFQKDAYVSVDFANHEIVVIQPTEGKTGDELIPGMNINKRSFDKSDALYEELKSFVKSVKNRETPEVSGIVGRDALKVALNIIDQIKISMPSYP
ncbi:MAG: Gfo/Idh/MocA family oxidoreductase [Desulfobacterales bacterium]|nr:Gfo/Idh/MocA family oxidoreductase [Desulfobacterales bacterium]MBF0396688.1 Gfo/Idh/MocA family oxidoreductase [Desulfobacterales bacterium]